MVKDVLGRKVVEDVKGIVTGVITVVTRCLLAHEDDESIADVYFEYLTLKELKQLIRERLEQKKGIKVAFGETQKIMDEHSNEILEKVPLMTMDELKQYCEETPYFIADYDSNTDEISDFTTIKTDGVEQKIIELMLEKDRIILFE